jgi:hypothetical protein
MPLRVPLPAVPRCVEKGAFRIRLSGTRRANQLSLARASILLFAAATLLPSSWTPLPALEATWAAKHRHSTDTREAPNPVLPLDHLVIALIDGVRWQEVFLGVDPRRSWLGVMNQYRTPSDLMPELHRIVRSRGVLIGGDDSKVRVSSRSTVSLPGQAAACRCCGGGQQGRPASLELDWSRPYSSEMHPAMTC